MFLEIEVRNQRLEVRWVVSVRRHQMRDIRFQTRDFKVKVKVKVDDYDKEKLNPDPETHHS